jgi:hypothetical protein
MNDLYAATFSMTNKWQIQQLCLSWTTDSQQSQQWLNCCLLDEFIDYATCS